MRTITLALVAATLSATAAFAQSPSGNVGQPERSFPQAGTTAGGPIDHHSVFGAYRNADDRLDVEDTGSVRSGPFISNREAVFEDSAKGGNAEQNQRSNPNLGTTSGGPEF